MIDLMTTNTNKDLPAAGGLINQGMQSVIDANRQYNNYQLDASLQEAPFQTISGPSPSDVERNGMGQFEYLARGGIENQAKTLANRIWEKRQKREQLDQFKQLLKMNEQGGKIIYDSFVQQYGEGIKDWIPETSFFYDEKTGAFMPYKYAERVAYGAQMYEAALARAKQKAQIGATIAGAQTPQEAAAGVVGAGGEVKDYQDAIGTIPKPLNAKDLQDISTSKAQEGYYNRMPRAGGGAGKKPPTPEDKIKGWQAQNLAFEKLIAGIDEKLIAAKPGVDDDLRSDMVKRKRQYERSISENNVDIANEKKKMSGVVSDSPQDSAQYIDASGVYSSVRKMEDEGFFVSDKDLAVYDKNGREVPGAFDNVINSVLEMMDKEGIILPGLPADQGGRSALIVQAIKAGGLDATINELMAMKAESQAGSQQPASAPASPVPAPPQPPSGAGQPQSQPTQGQMDAFFGLGKKEDPQINYDDMIKSLMLKNSLEGAGAPSDVTDSQARNR